MTLVKQWVEAGSVPIELHQVAVDPASLLTLTGVYTDITITGVDTTDVVVAACPNVALAAGLIPGHAYVKSANTVSVLIFNGSAGTIDGASALWNITIAKATIVTD